MIKYGYKFLSRKTDARNGKVSYVGSYSNFDYTPYIFDHSLELPLLHKPSLSMCHVGYHLVADGQDPSEWVTNDCFKVSYDSEEVALKPDYTALSYWKVITSNKIAVATFKFELETNWGEDDVVLMGNINELINDRARKARSFEDGKNREKIDNRLSKFMARLFKYRITHPYSSSYYLIDYYQRYFQTTLNYINSLK